MLTFAILSITCALVFYTAAVFGEKKAGLLKRRHVALFWAGLLFDTAGTLLMSRVAENSSISGFHGITGLIAIVLMAIHAVWGTVILIGHDENKKRNFHRLSVWVWTIWLVPFLSGMIYGMMK